MKFVSVVGVTNLSILSLLGPSKEVTFYLVQMEQCACQV